MIAVNKKYLARLQRGWLSVRALNESQANRIRAAGTSLLDGQTSRRTSGYPSKKHGAIPLMCEALSNEKYRFTIATFLILR